MESYIHPLVRHIELGRSHHDLRKRLIRRFRCLKNTRRIRCRAQFITGLVTRLLEITHVRSPHRAFRLLTGIWRIMQATRHEWEELERLDWIQCPRQQARRREEIREASPPPPILSVTPEPIPSLVFAVRPKCSYLLMDIEGPCTDVVEITVAACTRTEVVKVFHGYSRPHKSVEAQKAFRDGAWYCHGIKLEILHQLTEEHQDHQDLLRRVQTFCAEYKEATVLSADKEEESDIYRYLRQWPQSRRYKNIELSPWVDRIHETSHNEAQAAKTSMTPFKGVSCPYSRLHSPVLHISKRKRANGTRPDYTASDRAKMSSGTHCSLADVRELWLYLIATAQWPKEEACSFVPLPARIEKQ